MTYAVAPTEGWSFFRWLFQRGDRPFVSATRAGLIFALANIAVGLLANLIVPDAPQPTRALTPTFVIFALVFAPIVETSLLGVVVGLTSRLRARWILPVVAGVLAGLAHVHDGSPSTFVAPALIFALMSIQFRAWLQPDEDYLAAGCGVAWTHFVANAVLLSLAGLLSLA